MPESSLPFVARLTVSEWKISILDHVLKRNNEQTLVECKGTEYLIRNECIHTEQSEKTSNISSVQILKKRIRLCIRLVCADLKGTDTFPSGKFETKGHSI